MPGLLCPDWVFEDYTSVTPELLKRLGVRLLLTDLDFTLAPKKMKDADERVKSWLHALTQSGVEVAIISNNRNPWRVKRYCQTLDITYVGHAGKPAKRGFTRAMERFRASPKETAMLGDKLLTDVLGARHSGLTALMVEPAGGVVGPWQKVLHCLQEPFKRASAHDLRKT